MQGCDTTCFIPDDHTAPRRSALFMAWSVLNELRNGRLASRAMKVVSSRPPKCSPWSSAGITMRRMQKAFCEADMRPMMCICL